MRHLIEGSLLSFPIRKRHYLHRIVPHTLGIVATLVCHDQNRMP